MGDQVIDLGVGPQDVVDGAGLPREERLGGRRDRLPGEGRQMQDVRADITQLLVKAVAGLHQEASNLYPSPRIVTMRRGTEGSSSTLARSRLMCTSSVLVSPT